MQQMRKIPELRDVNTDQQIHGLEAALVVSIATPPRGSASPSQAIDNTLYDAFGQRQVSNDVQRHQPVLRRDGSRSRNSSRARGLLQQVYVASNTGKLVPLSAFAHFEPSNTRFP